jgi:hypothetical protein
MERFLAGTLRWN